MAVQDVLPLMPVTVKTTLPSPLRPSGVEVTVPLAPQLRAKETAVPPLSGTKSLVTVKVAEFSVLTIVQEAEPLALRLTLAQAAWFRV